MLIPGGLMTWGEVFLGAGALAIFAGLALVARAIAGRSLDGRVTLTDPTTLPSPLPTHTLGCALDGPGLPPNSTVMDGLELCEDCAEAALRRATPPEQQVGGYAER